MSTPRKDDECHPACHLILPVIHQLLMIRGSSVCHDTPMIRLTAWPKGSYFQLWRRSDYHQGWHLSLLCRTQNFAFSPLKRFRNFDFGSRQPQSRNKTSTIIHIEFTLSNTHLLKFKSPIYHESSSFFIKSPFILMNIKTQN